MNLPERINKELSKWDQQLSITDALGNNRLAYKLTDNGMVRSYVDILAGNSPKNINEAKKKAKDLDVELIIPKTKFPDYMRIKGCVWTTTYYDCGDFAFNTANLPQYTIINGNTDPGVLLHRDLPELKLVHEPEKGDVVLYFSNMGHQLNFVAHWGIVTDGQNTPLVQSKFGRGHVYEHPLGLVPTIYGNGISFFRKV